MLLPFYPSALVFVRQRGLFFSLWLTARTTNCPSTLKKRASQSKSLLNDRVRSLFGRSLEPLLSSGRQLPPLLLLPAPRRFLPFSRQPFSLLAPLVFSTARFRRVFIRLSPCRNCRRFWVSAPPYLSAPCCLPAPPDTPHCCFTRPRSVRLPGRSLAPLPGCLHPQWFCFSNDYLARTFQPARRFPC